MGSNSKIVARHFTRSGAQGHARRLNVRHAPSTQVVWGQPPSLGMRASGWGRLDYTVKRRDGVRLRPWAVIERSQ